MFDGLPEAQRPRAAALDVWTPARAQRLRWAQRVIERFRPTLTPRVPVTPLTVPLTPLEVLAQMATKEIARKQTPRHTESVTNDATTPAPRAGMRMAL